MDIAATPDTLRQFVLDKLAFFGCEATERYFSWVYPMAQLNFLVDEEKARQKLEVLHLLEAIALLSQELELDNDFLTTDWYKKDDQVHNGNGLLLVKKLNLIRNREHRERIVLVFLLEALLEEYAEPDYEHPDFD
jgi:hypothetical protein